MSTRKKKTSQKSSEESTDKKKAEDQKDLMAEIKKMEAEKREKAMESKDKKPTKKDKKDEKVSFDTWWMMRSKKIPQSHRKEVIRADFKGRKLTDKELVADWDKALKAYGLELK